MPSNSTLLMDVSLYKDTLWHNAHDYILWKDVCNVSHGNEMLGGWVCLHLLKTWQLHSEEKRIRLLINFLVSPILLFVFALQHTNIQCSLNIQSVGNLLPRVGGHLCISTVYMRCLINDSIFSLLLTVFLLFLPCLLSLVVNHWLWGAMPSFILAMNIQSCCTTVLSGVCNTAKF